LTTIEKPTMNTMHNPAHPGEVLRAYLPQNISVTDMAQRLGIPAKPSPPYSTNARG